MIFGRRGIAIVVSAFVLALTLAAQWWTALAALPFWVALHLLKTLLGWVDLAWRL